MFLRSQKFVLFAIIFIAVFFLMIFAGDGRQHIVDIVGTAFIIAGYFFVVTVGKRQRDLPLGIAAAWLFTLGYFAIRSIFSDDVGYSIYEFIRLLDAWLLYAIGFCYVSKPIGASVSKILIFITSVTLVFGVLMMVFPGIKFSGMNLVYAAYGHSHSADLALFALPLVLLLWHKQKTFQTLLLFFFYCCAIVFVYARAASAVAALYIILVTLSGTQIFLRRTATIAVALFLLTWSVLAFIYTPLVSRLTPFQTTSRFVNWKKPLSSDGRFEYWRQTTEAIREYPFFGSGPGTFYLQSVYRQRAPLGQSWFSHSFPLQTIAESGLVGFVLLFSIIGWSLALYLRYSFRYKNRLFDSNSEMAPSLFHGVFLVLVYSAIDYSLNFIVVWFLFWGILGLCSALFSQDKSVGTGRTLQTMTETASVLLLSLFYIVSVVGLAVPIVTSDPTRVFVSAPYRTDYSIRLYKEAEENKITVPQLVMQISDYFHKKNPEVILAKANYLNVMGESSQTIATYDQAVLLQKKNEAAYRLYAEYLIKDKHYEELSKLILFYADNFLPYSLRSLLDGARLRPEEVQYTEHSIMDLFDSSIIHELRFAKLFYAAGQASLGTDNTRTKALWENSRTLSPDLSYFYIELASLARYMLNDNKYAKDTLFQCDQQLYPSAHCKTYTLSTLPTPGYYAQHIQFYPAQPVKR